MRGAASVRREKLFALLKGRVPRPMMIAAHRSERVGSEPPQAGTFGSRTVPERPGLASVDATTPEEFS
jgi:hypothetical protein